MSDNLIIIEKKGGVATILLNRPKKRNALSLSMWSRIIDLVKEAEEDNDIKVIVLTGEGKAFAAGADIDEFESVFSDPASAKRTAGVTYDSQKQLSRCSKPTIAMIRGACVGGGCGLALHCDLRIADTTARFGITPGKLGLVYSLQDTKRLLEAVGPSKAKEILYTGKIIDASEALSIGLIDHLVEPELLTEAVWTLADEIGAASQFSVRATKKILQMILDGTKDDTEETRRLFVDAYAGDDFKEGYQAFKQKRAPKFTYS